MLNLGPPEESEVEEVEVSEEEDYETETEESSDEDPNFDLPPYSPYRGESGEPW